MDTNLAIKGNLGILRMNREHRYNMLTPNYIKNLRRAIDTLDQDDTVKLIYMLPEKGEHFCNGTDFRTILHYKKENKLDKVTNYLNELNNL